MKLFSTEYNYTLDDGPLGKTYDGKTVRVERVTVTDLGGEGMRVKAEGHVLKANGERDRRFSYRESAVNLDELILGWHFQNVGTVS